MMPSAEAFTTTIVAVVQAADGVRFVAAGKSADEVMELRVDYVCRRCEHVLWPRAAARVGELIEAGDSNGAVAEYFDNVGARWDEERLHTFCTTRDLVTTRIELRRGPRLVVSDGEGLQRAAGTAHSGRDRARVASGRCFTACD